MTDADNIPIDELDVSNPALFQQDSWSPHFARLRRERPVHYCPASPNGPYWSITRFDDIQAVELDHATFSSDSERGGIRIDNRLRSSFISSDPPRHTRERKTVAPVAAPTNLASYGVLIRDRTRRLLTALPRNETFDWAKDVSSELTVTMLATLFDFPLEDRHRLAFWSDALVCDHAAPDAPVKSEQERTAVLFEMADAFRALWNERSHQEPKLDLISMMAHNPDMQGMTENEFIGNLVLLVVGGYDTTKNAMSGSVLALSENPTQRVKLNADPSLVSGMVGEIVRYQSPIIHMCRTATRDTVFRDQSIKKDDRVVLWYVSANRDESVIDGADQFVIDRAKPNKHLAFGAGIHRCVGDRLAALQLKILWEEILDQKLVIEIDGAPIRQYSNFIRGFSRLPVRIRDAR
jgi:cytochrome P450